MANTEGMDLKFLIFKWTDLDYLTEEEFEQFDNLVSRINIRKITDGKKIDHSYLVINTDESYADRVIDIMKANGHWG